MDYEKKQRIYKTIMLVVLTVTVSVIGTTIGLYQYWGNNKDTKYVILPNKSNNEISTEIARLKAIIDKYYLGEVNEQDLIDGALQGYVWGLDDEYSEYIPKKDVEEFSTNTNGNYEGIGIYYGRLVENNKVVVISPIKDTPAYEAGILPGDLIIKINDEEIGDNESLDEISSKIKGKEGTQVKLTILRGDETKEFTIERKKIRLHYIDAEVFENNIGYMQFISFDEGTAKEFKEKYEELKNEGIRALIIDLRFNGGGIVQEATEIADSILKKDSTIVKIIDKNRKEEIIKAKTDDIIDLPIIILANSYTASASEILTGALRDNGVAKVVGETTYGKGVIQNVFTLKSGAALKITTSEYITPNGNKINKIGINPDLEVKLPEEYQKKISIQRENDTQLQKAIEMLNN